MKPSGKFREPLYEIAASLNNIFFPDEGRVLADSFFEQESLGSVRHYLKRPTRNRMLWTVRLFIGGKVRCIGATERGCDAARFADMAACRFAKYRKRSAAADSSNLNFSIAQVRADESGVPEAVEFLDLLEEYFLSNGVISAPPAENPVTPKLRGLKSDLLTLHTEVMLALAEIKLEIAKLKCGNQMREFTISSPPAEIADVPVFPAPIPGWPLPPVIGDDPNGPKFTC